MFPLPSEKITSATTLGLGLLAVLAACPASADPAAQPRRPNIIYIMADDLGYGDLGCFGQRMIKTPRLDALARQGMRLTDHYSGHTVCRPSRLVLLTGRHSGNTPIHSNAQYALPAGAQTVTSLLKKAGYATGGIGKWALGGPQSPGAPTRQGFDSWVGYLDQGNAHNYYPEFLWRNTEKLPLAGNVIGRDKRVAVKRTTYAHDVMTDAALAFIREHAERPFLLQAHYTIPHANNEGGRATGNGMEVPDWGAYADRDWPDTEKGFAAMVSLLDADVGKIIDLLKELRLERQTLVIFTSDNGPHQEGGHKLGFFDSNGPLRGFKRDLYEGGIRVPTIAWWPGTITPGTASDHPSAFWDWLPTACELAGISPPEDTDGISYAPTLRGAPQRTHDYLYWKYGKKAALRKDSWKLVRPKPDTYELYDLAADLGETQDLSEKHPQVARKLREIMHEYDN